MSSVFDYAETESNGKKQLVVRREAFEHACPFGGFKKRGQGEGEEGSRPNLKFESVFRRFAQNLFVEGFIRPAF